MKNFYRILIAVVILFGAGLFFGYKLAPQVKTEITAETILQSLKGEGFFVTQTYIFHEKVDIDKTTGSQFKDIFWKQNITAAANMKVSAGIDLSKLEEKDIKITRNKIEVHVSEIETYGVEILGDVTLNNSQGILKKIFDSEDGYNESITLLKKQALEAVEEDELKIEARTHAQKEIARIIGFLDSEGREVEIMVK